MTTHTVAQAVATREEGPVRIMWSQGSHFKAVLPDHIDVKSFLGTAAAALYASEELMKCATQKPDTLITALFRCAALGHQPGTDEFYLTPRKGGILGIEGYRGVIERMYRSGAVKSVVVREVCARDKFRFTEGDDDKPRHSFGGGEGFADQTGADFFGAEGFRDRGPMVGVYAYATLTTGAVSRVVVLNRADVMAAREASDAKDSKYSPWNRLDAGAAHPEFTGRSMWWKTAAKRLEPWVPTSAEYRREQLRAAAAAAQAPTAAGAPVPGSNGGAQHVAPEPVYDAEIVDETPGPAVPDGKPASGPAAGPGHPKAQAAGKAALDKLDGLIRQLGLGSCPDDDMLRLYEWVTGPPWTASRTQVTQMAGWLDDHLKQAQGDADAAFAAIWRQLEAQHPAAGEADDG